jgi:predicted lactoylglutathione lyase
MDTVEIKAFVPARDFELSKRFYADVGFDIRHVFSVRKANERGESAHRAAP